MSQASKILEWENAGGQRRALLVVISEEDKHLEVCSLNKEDEWKTDETLEEFSQIVDFGIPESILG